MLFSPAISLFVHSITHKILENLFLIFLNLSYFYLSSYGTWWLVYRFTVNRVSSLLLFPYDRSLRDRFEIFRDLSKSFLEQWWLVYSPSCVVTVVSYDTRYLEVHVIFVISPWFIFLSVITQCSYLWCDIGKKERECCLWHPVCDHTCDLWHQPVALHM